ncbi:MAG: xanthine dehydrogenase family protein subunit M, partial [Moorella sp. (in: Bacteria)]|nr:xanthine dehydrogenase family protein subunit M [Moorella sp. (in: firmicutes)]
RVIAVEDLYAGPGRSRVDSSQSIVTGIYIPWQAGRISAFKRLARRRALALPVLNIALAILLEEGVIKKISVAAGPVGPQPLRLREVEAVLQGREVTPDIIDEAARVAAAVARPRDSVLRGSREYRRELLGVLVRRILIEATA